ncbi:hypothetical protein QTP88_017088 [Uroleucon formosanum]
MAGNSRAHMYHNPRKVFQAVVALAAVTRYTACANEGYNGHEKMMPVHILLLYKTGGVGGGRVCRGQENISRRHSESMWAPDVIARDAYFTDCWANIIRGEEQCMTGVEKRFSIPDKQNSTNVVFYVCVGSFSWESFL